MQTLEFVLKPSRFFKYYLHLLHLLGFLILITLKIDLFYRIILILLFCFYWIKNITAYLGAKNKHSIYRIWHQSNGEFGFETQGGMRRLGILMGDSYKCSLFMIIRIKSKHKVRSIFIPKDALPPEEYRRLCTRILFF